MKASMDIITDPEISTKVYVFLLSETHPEKGVLTISPYKPCHAYISRNTGESYKRVKTTMRKLEDLGAIWDIEDGLAVKDSYKSRFVSLSRSAVKCMLKEDLSRDEMSVLLYLADKDRYFSGVGMMFTFTLGHICETVLDRFDNSRNREKTKEILKSLSDHGFIRYDKKMCLDNHVRYRVLGVDLEGGSNVK